MIEPVILLDTILHQARLWDAACQRYSPVPLNAPPIGEAHLTSPVDGSVRRVMLRVGGMLVKGKTIRGIFTDSGVRIADGYTVALDSDIVEQSPGMIIHVLLHEMIHALDPRFDEDEEWQDQNGRITSKAALYRLTSERRAFTGMWVEALRTDLEQQRYSSPDNAIAAYRLRLTEFDYFCAYNADAMDDIRSVFQSIVADLQKRP